MALDFNLTLWHTYAMNTFMPIPHLTNERKNKFWSHVDIKSGLECWNWKGAKYQSGYGTMTFDGMQFLAHRLAWALSNRADPGKMLVCHHCDNPSCCNPSHLFLGTASDNNVDAIKKGHKVSRHGINHPNAKLTQSDVEEIRLMKKLGYSQHSIARKFNIYQSTVSRIVRFERRAVD